MVFEALAVLGEEPLAFLDVVGIEETDGAIETVGLPDGASDGETDGSSEGELDGAVDGAVDVDGVSEGATDDDGAEDTDGPAEGAADNDGSEEIEGAAETVGACVFDFFDDLNFLDLPDK